MIYPRLRVALTNAPRENLESAFGDDSVAPNFPVELPVPPVDLQQTVIAPTGPCEFDETYDTWARQVLKGTGGQNGNGVKVCVVDTGLQCDHPDFASRPLDDVHIQPFNPAEVIDDSYGHGTHCAGIICGPPQPHKAPRYGIAPGVELFVANVFGKAYETTVDTLIDALEWAIARGCHIVSMSLFKPVDPDDNQIMKFSRGIRKCSRSGHDAGRLHGQHERSRQRLRRDGEISGEHSGGARGGWRHQMHHDAECTRIPAATWWRRAITRGLPITPPSDIPTSRVRASPLRMPPASQRCMRRLPANAGATCSAS